MTAPPKTATRVEPLEVDMENSPRVPSPTLPPIDGERDAWLYLAAATGLEVSEARLFCLCADENRPLFGVSKLIRSMSDSQASPIPMEVSISA